MEEIIIYQSKSGQVEVRLDQETVWLKQEQMAKLFGRDRTVIGRHREILAKLKKNLKQRGEAGNLFAQERGASLEAILGNLEQTAFGDPVYPTLESKAAHLLYFVVKKCSMSICRFPA